MSQDPYKYLSENKVVSTYAVLLVLTVLFLWFISHFNIAYPLTITQKTTSGELAVVGTGKIDIVPDTANVELGIVVNNAKTVDEAQNQINQVNNAIVSEMQKLGINKDDIKTSNYSISPNYNYQVNPNGQISGYNGNATVTIKVKDTSKLADVIQAGTKAGANQVMGTSYSIDKPENFREQARTKAIENAKEQAQKLASNLGIRLGKIVNIVESTGNDQYPIPMLAKSPMGMGMGGGAASPDLQPGTQTITSTVTLYFDKK